MTRLLILYTVLMLIWWTYLEFKSRREIKKHQAALDEYYKKQLEDHNFRVKEEIRRNNETNSLINERLKELGK